MGKVERVARAIGEAAFKGRNRRDSSLQQYSSAEQYADERWKVYKAEAIAAIAAAKA